MPHYLNKVLATPGTLNLFGGGGSGAFKDVLRTTLVFLPPGKVLISEMNVS